MKSLDPELMARVWAVCDPELGDVTIGELGMVRSVTETASEGVAPAQVTVELISTFLGCPARSVIESAVLEALAPSRVALNWGTSVWSETLVSPQGRVKLAALGIAVGDAPCPRCENSGLRILGPSATNCRSVARCSRCNEIVEVLRSAASPVRLRVSDGRGSEGKGSDGHV